MQLTRSTAGVSERYALSAGTALANYRYAYEPWGAQTGRRYRKDLDETKY